ncbi:MAG TPA: orotidine-5'-phosphate decarboxylase [Candidatus Limnocylindrales bacterium]|nr:orotidine-5'-phosphate decarboxylase [Candidatus Limnocylindrales bacterium]
MTGAWEGDGSMHVQDRLIVALDRPDLKSALEQVDRVGDAVLWYKVGLQLYNVAGRAAVLALADRGKRVFLDLKLHDIPATVERAVRALEGLPIALLTVHASGGPEMLRAAAAAARYLAGVPRVLGVTMLTSLDGTEIPALFNPKTDVEEKVLALATLCAESGVDGVVASPREIQSLRLDHPSPFLVVTPGIRGPNDPAHDQKRTLSLAEAFARGADYVVVGRPILEAPDPRAVVASYQESLIAAAREKAGA